MTAHTSRRGKNKIKSKQGKSVLNGTLLVVRDTDREPVVNLGLKEVLREAFGFIKVGGDFG